MLLPLCHAQCQCAFTLPGLLCDFVAQGISLLCLERVDRVECGLQSQHVLSAFIVQLRELILLLCSFCEQLSLHLIQGLDKLNLTWVKWLAFLVC